MKCGRALNIIKFLCGTWWGSDPETLVIFYKSYIRSIIDYSSFIYCPLKANLLNKIQKIQNLGIRIALGYRLSTPSNVIHAESKLVPIVDRIKYLCDTYLAKIMSNTGSLSYKCIQSYYKIYLKKLPKKVRLISRSICDIMRLENLIIKNVRYSSYCFDYDDITLDIPVNLELGKEIKNSASPDDMLNKFLDRCNSCAFFTDGSKSIEGEAVGSSVYCPSLGLNLKSSHNKYMSVFSAECAAIADALESIFDKKVKNPIIFSDSLSALQSMSSNKITVKTNPFILRGKKIYREFVDRDPENVPRLFWIPAHCGVMGNEFADKLAKLATLNDTSDSFSVPYTDFKEHFKHNMYLSAKSALLSQGLLKGTKYFNTFYRDSKKPWYSGLNLSRSYIVTINRCRANHYGLAESLHRIKIINDAKCKCNSPTEDINHVLWQCKLYDNNRQELIDNLKKVKIFLPCSVDSLLSSPDSSACQYIYEFLQKCNLKI